MLVNHLLDQNCQINDALLLDMAQISLNLLVILFDARHLGMLGRLVLDNLEIGYSCARSILDFFNARPITN